MFSASRESNCNRIDPDLLNGRTVKGADDDLRSLNNQIEFLLRKSLLGSERLKN